MMMVVLRVNNMQMKKAFLTLRTSQAWAKARAQAKEQPEEKAKEKAEAMPKEEPKEKGKENIWARPAWA